MAEIIVDTSIAKRAGGLSPIRSDLSVRPLESLGCAEMLDTILDSDIFIIFTPELIVEWTRRMTSYSSNWLVTIISRGRQKVLSNYEFSDLRIIIGNLDQNDRVPLSKDVHLVEAALRQNCPVTAIDRKARYKFIKLSKHYPRIMTIIWVDPLVDFEWCKMWIKKDMPYSDAHLLKP